MIVLDGAMGTELNRRGSDTSLPLWSARALIETPQLVTAIHRDYIEAGATVITVNSFRTNVRTLERAGLPGQTARLTRVAVDCAAEARAGRTEVKIAGSLAPVEDCYTPSLVPDDKALLREHTALAQALALSGCDLMLVETMNCAREAAAATQAAAATGLPVWVSFTLGSDNRLLSGETLSEAVAAVGRFQPEAFLVNCIPVVQVESALEALRGAAPHTQLGAYGNVGHVDDEVGWTLTDAVSPEAYRQAARRWRAVGAGIIGGCCGTSPAHIRALSED